MTRADHRHCLATSPARWRCAVYLDREELMSMDPNRGPWRDDFDARPSCAGRSIVGMMEDHLDTLVAALMVVPDPNLAGQARGVATCIALIRTPYAPDESAVRDEAMIRWQRAV